MTDISELERRISYALELIARSADRVVNHTPTDGDMGVHPDPLSEELKERLAQLSHDYDAQGAALLEARATLEALAESNRALRAGADQDGAEPVNNADGRSMERRLADLHLANESLRAEVAAMRATHAAERAELAALLSQLRPLIEDQMDA